MDSDELRPLRFARSISMRSFSRVPSASINFLNQSTDAKIFSAAARRLMSLLSLAREIFDPPF